MLQKLYWTGLLVLTLIQQQLDLHIPKTNLSPFNSIPTQQNFGAPEGAPAALGVQKAAGSFGHIQQAQQIPPQCTARAASLSLSTFPAIFLFFTELSMLRQWRCSAAGTAISALTCQSWYIPGILMLMSLIWTKLSSLPSAKGCLQIISIFNNIIHCNITSREIICF